LIVVIDASTFVSAALKADSLPERALLRAVDPPNRLDPEAANSVAADPADVVTDEPASATTTPTARPTATPARKPEGDPIATAAVRAQR